MTGGISMDDELRDRLAIRNLIENWVVWPDRPQDKDRHARLERRGDAAAFCQRCEMAQGREAGSVKDSSLRGA
jgi:hypothetical protein